MKTPICDFVENYAREGSLRLHMPGHKGIPFLGVEERDITEVEGADVLYGADGIIAESEKYASELFGSGKTVYSTEGSSLCIRAMVSLIALQAKSEGKRPLILAARNAHKAFMSALALVDCEVEWLCPAEGESLISCRVTANMIEEKLEKMSEIPTAVYLTSPDYLGVTSDIENIAKLCHKKGILLAADNAHGAYLRFLSRSKHPLDLGADICCDSAHKTLPVLTGGAYLHISKIAPATFFEMAEQTMALFASTSPSYLIMQSLDMANKYLSEGYVEKLCALISATDELKARLTENGYSLIGDEKLKLCFDCKKYGYFGFEMAELLLEKGIVCEFSDRDYLVMMFTPEISAEDVKKLSVALLSLPRKSAINEKAPSVGCPERVMSVREAAFSPSVEVDAENACGRVLAVANVACPPAIPVVVCGERIDDKAIECFKYYGIDRCRVVK